MSELEVYDSRGKALYPETMGPDPKMASYFDSHIFTIGVNEGQYIVEAYLNVNTGMRKEQVAVRYRDSTEGTLSDCRRAIQTTLVEELGWEIRRPHGNKPGKVSWDILWNDELTTSERYSPRDLYTDTEFGLGLASGEAELLVQLRSEDDQTVQINASSYEDIGKIVPAFDDSDSVVAVSRERHAPPDYADVHFSVADKQWNTFQLHPTTRDRLDEKKSELRSQQRTESLENLQQNLQLLYNLNTSEDTVTRQLNASLSETYSSLEVVDSSVPRQTNNNVTVSSTNTGSGSKNLSSNNRFTKKEGALIAFFVLVLVLIGIILSWVLVFDEPLLGISSRVLRM